MKIPKFEAQTEWVKPTEFPDLRRVDEIAIDLETKDPGLKERGSGSVIGDGDVVGIAVATSHYKGYFPIAHEGGGNMDRQRVMLWLKDVLESQSTKIFHNAIYDVCWLRRLEPIDTRLLIKCLYADSPPLSASAYKVSPITTQTLKMAAPIVLDTKH